MADAGNRSRSGKIIIFRPGRAPPPNPLFNVARAVAVMAIVLSLLFGVGLLSEALANWVAPSHSFKVAYLSSF
jgi:hypothetical protein